MLAGLDDFTLSLISDQQLGIPEGNFLLHAVRTEGTLQLELNVQDARALRGLMLQLDYNAQRWQALAAEAGSLLEGGGTLLQLADLDKPGQARLGQVLANWDECEGVDGNGVLARFSFREGSSAIERRSSQVADADSARARLEFLQAGDTQRLIWFHTNPGDYNQDGVVSISDLTPLGQNFGDSGPFAHSSAEAVVDGDGNDEINISDLTVIGQNLGNEVMEYAVYWSSRPDLDIPENNSADLGQTASAILDGSEQFNPFTRRRYIWDIDNESALLPGSVLWVRPLDGAGHPGTPSNHTGEDNGDPAGQAAVVHLAVSQFSGEVPLTITMDASKSFDPRGGGIDSFSYIVDNEPLASFSGYQLSDESYTVEITEAGSYMLSLSATHAGFTSTTRPVLLSVTQGGNRAPLAIASLPNIFSFVRTPATYLIDFADSYDPDGDPLSFELDLWSGTRAIPLPRGDFEISNPSGTQYELTIVEPGSYAIDIRATDDKGLSDIDTLTLEVLAEDSFTVPRAALYPDGYAGTAPYEVQFELFTAAAIPEFTIDKLELDPQGQGNWQLLDPAQQSFSYTYQGSGSMRPRLRVTDNRGYQGYSDAGLELQISSQAGIAPTAMLTAAQTSGLFQLSVNLDARASFDQFGRIVSYEFDPGDGSGWRDDPDNDGWFPWLYLTGEYDALVKVTDDEGLSDTASLHISVS
ncbi:hypothetical protein KDL44_07155 [bacterium]|nr:hypothetical protein [bacterium]